MRVSWAIVCGAYIGEAEDEGLFGSDGEVDPQLLDAELEGRTKTSVWLQEDEDPVELVIPDNVDDLIEARPTVIAAPVSPSLACL